MKARPFRGPACLLAAAALLVSFAAAGQAQAPAGPSGKPHARNEAARQEGWPKKIPFGEATLVLEAPRAEALDGTKLRATSAVRMEGGATGAAELSSGTITFDADVEIDRQARTVTLTSVRVAKIDVGRMPPARKERIGARLTQVMNKVRPTLPLDGQYWMVLDRKSVV